MRAKYGRKGERGRKEEKEEGESKSHEIIAQG